MQGTKPIIAGALLALVVLLGVPFAAHVRSDVPPGAWRRLVVVTPHVQQIRDEFARAFGAWHQREYGEAVTVDYRTPGGTSDILRQLQAEFRARLAEGRYTLKKQGNGYEVEMEPGTIGADLMFGGGSYDHGLVARGVKATLEGPDGPIEIDVPMSAPAGLSKAELDEAFGENKIGTQTLYDPKQYWVGTALSSFGIVYNRDAYTRLGLETPKSFNDLTDPHLRGWLALADPRQSGSITTTFDSILGNHGWVEGWRILRDMCGNTRYFTSASTKPPADVSTGDAAAGLAIDFYGRGQAQEVADAGDPDRMGYIDPAGEVYIDADPISILRGAHDTELARRFLRFVLSEEGQALWQFPALDGPDGASNPVGPGGEKLGPKHNELRRMPIRRDMYAKYFDHFRDKVNPFEIASNTANPGWRTGVMMMMGCFGIDSGEHCRAAWDAIARAGDDPAFPADVLREMTRRFHVFPETPIADKDGSVSLVPFTEATYHQVRNAWRDPVRESQLRIDYTAFFIDRYREIVEMGRNRSMVPMRGSSARTGADGA
ncbi:MAG: extracellular solute-binding protein [Phycisphaeraceae bacterium]|nr:MAG: extracellular solute-binding protein [Phycisphaeraceae bacterium]